MKNEQLLQKLEDTSDLYQLLSIAFRMVDREIVVGLQNGTFFHDVRECLQSLGCSADELEPLATVLATAASFEEQELLSKMRIEYTRLFLVPKNELVQIYETMFKYKIEGGDDEPSLFTSPCAMHAEQCYQKAGVMPAATCKEPQDRLSTELEFISYLYCRQAEALNAEDTAAFDKIAAQIDEFKKTHLDCWLKLFMQQVSEQTELNFYQAFAKIGLLTAATV